MFESARRSVLIVGYAFYGSDRIFKPLARPDGGNSGLTVRIDRERPPRTRLDRRNKRYGNSAKDFFADQLAVSIHDRRSITPLDRLRTKGQDWRVSTPSLSLWMRSVFILVPRTSRPPRFNATWRRVFGLEAWKLVTR